MTDQIRHYDASGREIFWHTINTICPIQYADAARLLSHKQLVEFEGSHDAIVSKMLPVNLAPIEGGDATHVFCSREGLCHQVEAVAVHFAERSEEWIAREILTEADGVEMILSKFCVVLGDKNSLLNFLGLREVE